ncbi:MAG: OmpA family protein [Thiohalocapsa sp.]
MARRWAFAGLLLGVLAAPPLGLAADITAPAAKPIGQIKRVSGSVTIVRGSEQLRAKPGAAIFQGDVIRSGPDGSIGVAFADNSLFSAGPSTEVAVPDFRFDAGSGRGNMLAVLGKGTLTAVSGRITHTTPGAMSIRTPTAILGVRGTTFAIEVVRVGLCQCVSDHTAPHLRCVTSAHFCQITCASPHYSFVPMSSAELAACPPQEHYPQERYVVLPNADGRPGAGAITVSHAGTATTLDRPYAAAELRDGGTTARAMKPSEAQDIFEEAFAARPALPAQFRLDFTLGSERMAPQSLADYRALVAEIKKRQAYQVELVGRPDTRTSEAHDRRLAWDRAMTVRAALMRDGVDAGSIIVDGRGDARQPVRGSAGGGKAANPGVEATIR